MADAGFKLNHAALKRILTSPQAHDLVLKQATEACQRANDWANSVPRSGAHRGDVGPHFEVVAEESKNRARYTVRPRTGFGTWLAMTEPAGLMACLDL